MYNIIINTYDFHYQQNVCTYAICTYVRMVLTRLSDTTTEIDIVFADRIYLAFYTGDLPTVILYTMWEIDRGPARVTNTADRGSISGWWHNNFGAVEVRI